MSVKKIVVAICITGLTCAMMGCGAKKNTTTAANDYSEKTAGVQTVSSFSGEVMSPEEENALLNTRVVHFAFDDSAISSADHRVLNVHARFMLDNPNVALTIKGHTDERGSRAYNVALGERRGASVARYLETKGVPCTRITVVSYGKEQPINLQSNELAWAENRRAELDYEHVG